MRAKLSPENLKRLFEAVVGNGDDEKKISFRHRVTTRTVNEWRRGGTSMPLSVFDDLLTVSQFRKKTLAPKVLNDFWHIKNAAHKGAFARMKLYGNAGTLEGRRRGGLASIAAQKNNLSGFKTLKSIFLPGRSIELAELLGILIGDGHLSGYQVSLSTNSQTDREHALYVKRLIQRLFDVAVTLKKIRGENALSVVVSSKNMVDFLQRLGMPIGNKILNGLVVPAWIRAKPLFQKAFIRGLFDTDGCVYLDTHIIKGKVYAHMGWTITSYAPKLLMDIADMLRELGFSPTQRVSQKSVFLRRQKEIVAYFRKIGSHNPKHLRRYKGFKKEIKN